MSFSLGELAVRFGCELRGSPDRRVEHVATLAHAGPTDISFLANPKYGRDLKATGAGAVVLDAAVLDACPVDALITATPYAIYARIAQLLHPMARFAPGIHPTALVESSADVDPTAHIGAFAVVGSGSKVAARASVGTHCVLGSEVILGEDVQLAPRVTILDRVQIGARSIIHPGAVIGADGFGFAQDPEGWIKVPQIGAVVIGTDVEIGANTTIDRGAIEHTQIGDGVKLDNLIQIAHNVRIGAHTIMAACVGVSGSTQIGERCMFGGGIGIGGHLTICNDVSITGFSMVSHSISKPGIYSGGIPIEPARDWRRIVAWLKLNSRKARDSKESKDD